jgi:hypothetical protein
MLKIITFGLILLIAGPARAAQTAWNNPNVNMAAGSVRPGHAQLHWAPGTTLPIRLRNGMMTMINLPRGEMIEDAIAGNSSLFDFDSMERIGNTMMIQPAAGIEGGDTNLILMGSSGNRYIFYVRIEPSTASEITHSQVDVIVDGFAGSSQSSAASGGPSTSGGSLFNRRRTPTGGTFGADGEDFGWIRSMKIDPAEFRFDLDIFVPNPDDFVIAPERVWRDRIFTYIDFGDKVIAMTQRPVVSILIEGGESPVGFRTDGEHGRLIIVEAVGDMVLRSGQRLVCIKKRSRPFLVADTASVMRLAEANVMQSMFSNQSLNNVVFGGMPMMPAPGMVGHPMMPGMGGGMPMMPMQPQQPMMMPQQFAPQGGGGGRGMNMIPQERTTAGSFLPQSNIPLIRSNQVGVAVELRSDTSVKALNDYWTRLLAQFSGDEGAGLLNPYRDMVFFAVDEQGVGDLGASGNTARLYRLRIGPLSNIDEAQVLCDHLQRFRSIPCHVVRVQ